MPVRLDYQDVLLFTVTEELRASLFIILQTVPLRVNRMWHMLSVSTEAVSYVFSTKVTPKTPEKAL